MAASAIKYGAGLWKVGPISVKRQIRALGYLVHNASLIMDQRSSQTHSIKHFGGRLLVGLGWALPPLRPLFMRIALAVTDPSWSVWSVD